MLNEEHEFQYYGLFSELREEVVSLYEDIDLINHNLIGFATECDIIEYKGEEIVGYLVEAGPFVLKLKSKLSELRRVWPKIDSEYDIDFLKRKIKDSRKSRLRVPGRGKYKRREMGDVTELVGGLLGTLSNLNRRLKVIDRNYSELKSQRHVYRDRDKIGLNSQKIKKYAKNIIMCVGNEDIWLHYKENWKPMNEGLKFFDREFWNLSDKILQEIDDKHDNNQKLDEIYENISRNWANDVIQLVNTQNYLR